MALEDRDGQRALWWLDVADWIDRDRADTHFLMARAYRRLGRWDQVRHHLEEAWRIGYPVDSLQREQWLALAQSGQLAAAEPHLSELLMDPRDDGREICEAFVSGYLLHHRFSEAFAIIDAWRRQYPDDYLPHYALGLTYQRLSQWPDAAEAFRQALELAPERVDVRSRLGQVLVHMHEYDEAIGHFREGAARDPHNVPVFVGWARCLMAQGEHAEARSVLERAHDLSEDAPGVRLALGELALAERRPEEALEWLQSAFEQRPLDSSVRYALAQALRDSGNQQAAQEHFAFVAQATEARSRVQDLMEIVLREPRNAEARYEIGATLLRYEAPDDGAAWLRSVLDIDPQHQRAHAALAQYYTGLGNAELAEQHRQQAESVHDDASNPSPLGTPGPPGEGGVPSTSFSFESEP